MSEGYEFREIFKSIYFVENLQTTAFKYFSKDLIRALHKK